MPPQTQRERYTHINLDCPLHVVAPKAAAPRKRNEKAQIGRSFRKESCVRTLPHNDAWVPVCLRGPRAKMALLQIKGDRCVQRPPVRRRSRGNHRLQPCAGCAVALLQGTRTLSAKVVGAARCWCPSRDISSYDLWPRSFVCPSFLLLY